MEKARVRALDADGVSHRETPWDPGQPANGKAAGAVKRAPCNRRESAGSMLDSAGYQGAERDRAASRPRSSLPEGDALFGSCCTADAHLPTATGRSTLGTKARPSCEARKRSRLEGLCASDTWSWALIESGPARPG